MTRNKISRAREYMKTTITFTVIQTEPFTTIEIQDAMEQGFNEFDRVVQRFTRFHDSSELSNLNRNSGKWVNVTPELFSLVQQMLALSAASDGAFDPTVIDFLETYGYDKNYDFSKLNNPDLDNMVSRIARIRPSWQQIKLDPTDNAIYLAENQRLDLGGIGKGYAIDLAMDKMRQFTNVLIDAGGDLRALGRNELDEPWKLGMKHLPQGASPEEAQIIGQIVAEDLALACSGSWARKVKQFHHIIDPRSGKPVDAIQTVYVTAPTAIAADSWATTLFVGGKGLLKRLPTDMAALLIFADNKAVQTPNFPKYQ